VSEFVITTIDEARRMLNWLTKRRRTTLTSLVRAAEMRSSALVNFGSLDEAARRTNDTTLSLILQVVRGNDHRVIARPAGAKHLQVQSPGAVPLEIRAAGGGLLEIPLNVIEDVRTLARTMEAVNNCSLTAICSKAGVSTGLVSYVNGVGEQQDLRLRTFLEVLLAGGLELVVQPCFANAREARFSTKLADR
jgi:hypothetical protein